MEKVLFNRLINDRQHSHFCQLLFGNESTKDLGEYQVITLMQSVCLIIKFATNRRSLSCHYAFSVIDLLSATSASFHSYAEDFPLISILETYYKLLNNTICVNICPILLSSIFHQFWTGDTKTYLECVSKMTSN